MQCLWKRAYSSTRERSVAHEYIAAICWNVWKERNNRIFSSTAHSIETYMVIIHSDISAWTGILSEKERPDNFSEKEDIDMIHCL